MCWQMEVDKVIAMMFDGIELGKTLPKGMQSPNTPLVEALVIICTFMKEQGDSPGSSAPGRSDECRCRVKSGYREWERGRYTTITLNDGLLHLIKGSGRAGVANIYQQPLIIRERAGHIRIEPID